jgi:lipopolysaccharide biosynthesis regulator YciM
MRCQNLEYPLGRHEWPCAGCEGWSTTRPRWACDEPDSGLGHVGPDFG